MERFRLPLHRMSQLACALALAGTTACGGSDASPPHNARVEAGLQQVLDQAVAKPGVFVPGAIIHYHQPAYAPWSGSAGQRDLQAQAPMQPANRIRAGSLLKTFVATVTLQLVEEGALSLDQTLPELLPASVTDRVANADRITLRMLLNHTSGIPEWDTDAFHMSVATDPAHVWTPDALLDLAVAQPPTFEPGTSWSYSNTNYTLIGMVLDRVGGRSWREQVRARLIAPLGLASTALPEPGDRTVTADYAHGYQDIGGGVTLDLSDVDPSMAGAAGGAAMVSTVQDVARFLETLLQGRLFARPGTLAEMTTMVPAPDPSGLPHWYGLGLESYDIGGTTLIGNAGGTAGYATMAYRIPARDTTLVTSINSSDMMTNAMALLLPALDVLNAAAP